MAATSGGVTTGAIINIITVLIGFLVFSWLRTKKFAYKYFDPKRYTPEIQRKPAPLPATLLGWIMPVFRYSEPDVIRECGLDSAIYLRLLAYGFQLFTFMSFWCLVTILPTNATGGECARLMSEPDSQFKYTGFDKLSLANVAEGDNRMFVHVVSVYIIVAFALMLLWRFSKDSVLLRIQFLGNSRPSGPTHSVLVTDIPAISAVAVMAAERHNNDHLKAKHKISEGGQQPSSRATHQPAPMTGGHRTTGDHMQVNVPDEYSTPVEEIDSGRSTPAQRAMLSLANPADRVAGKQDTQGTLHQRRTFNYDCHDTSLDPSEMAEKRLAEGLHPSELVEDEFRQVYGDKVQAVQHVYDQVGLVKYLEEYDKRKQDLEDYLDGVRDKSSQNEPQKPAKVSLGMFPDAWAKEKYGGGFFKKVDALPFWRDRLLYLEGKLLEQQPLARKLIWPTAFVTFKTRLAQSISATGLHHHDESTWRVQNAPEPRELIWKNLGYTSSSRSTKNAIGWVLFWIMTCFFMIPIAFLQALIDVSKFATMPGVSGFVNNVVVKALLEAIVPGLVLKIFLALVPAILAAMMKAAGAVSLSEVDFGVVSRYFLFQVVVVFFGNTALGSFFSAAQEWISNPTGVFGILGGAIPQACTFFISFIWIQMGTYPLRLIIGFIIFRIKTMLAHGPRARARLYQEQYTTYGKGISSHTIIILLGLVFCLINPVITPTVLAYFLVASIIEKYMTIYMQRRHYESSGLLWVRLLNQVMTGIYIFEIVMIGLLAIKKFPYTVLIVPVLIPTVIFHMVVLKLYGRPWKLMSLHDASELDQNEKQPLVDPETMEAAQPLDPEQYVAPAFKVHKGDLNSLLAEAQRAEAVVQADVAHREATGENKKKRCGCC